MRNDGRIVLLTLEFHPQTGGIQKILFERAKNSHPELLTVITSKTKEYERRLTNPPYDIIWAKNIKETSIFFRLSQTLFPILSFLKFARKNRVQSIECGQAFPFPIFCWIYKKLTQTPYSVWCHGNDVYRFSSIPILDYFVKKSLRNANRIYCLSNFVSGLVERLGVSKSQISILKYRMDPLELPTHEKNNELIDRLGLRGKNVISTVGRLVPRKGIDTVLRSLGSVLNDFPNTVYMIIGSGSDYARLRRIVEELGLEDQVRFIQDVKDEEIHHYYGLTDLFIMVSREISKQKTVEGFGLVYIEAQALGIPVIAGRSGGIPDAIMEGVTGFLVDPESPSDIANSIKMLLSDRKLMETMGKNAKNFACAGSNWQIFDPQHI